MANAPQIADRLCPIKEVLEIVQLGRTAWYDGIRKGRYPEPVRLSKRTSRWRLSDIKRLVDHGPLDQGRVQG